MPRIDDPKRRQYLDGLHRAIRLNRIFDEDYKEYKRAYRRHLKGLQPATPPPPKVKPLTYTQQQSKLAIIKELTDLARHTYAPRIIVPKRVATKETMMRTRGTVKYEDGGVGNAVTVLGSRMAYSDRKPIRIIKGGIKTEVRRILKAQQTNSADQQDAPQPRAPLTLDALMEKLTYYPELGIFEWNATDTQPAKAAGHMIGYGKVDRARDPLESFVQPQEEPQEVSNDVVHVPLIRRRRGRKRWWNKDMKARELKKARARDKEQVSVLSRLNTLKTLCDSEAATRMLHTTTTLDIIESQAAYPKPPRLQRKIPKLSKKARVNRLKAAPDRTELMPLTKLPTKRRNWVPVHTGYRLATEEKYNYYYKALKHPANRTYLNNNLPPIDPRTVGIPDPKNPLQKLKPKLLMPVYKRYYNVRASVGSTEATELRTYYITPQEPAMVIQLNGVQYRAERLAYLYMLAGGNWDYSDPENPVRVNTFTAPEGLYAHSMLTNKRLKVKFRDGNTLNFAWDNIKPASPLLERVKHPRAQIRALAEKKDKPRVTHIYHPGKCISRWETEKGVWWVVNVRKAHPTRKAEAEVAYFDTYDEALCHLHATVKKIIASNKFAIVRKDGSVLVREKKLIKSST